MRVAAFLVLASVLVMPTAAQAQRAVLVAKTVSLDGDAAFADLLANAMRAAFVRTRGYVAVTDVEVDRCAPADLRCLAKAATHRNLAPYVLTSEVSRVGENRDDVMQIKLRLFDTVTSRLLSVSTFSLAPDGSGLTLWDRAHRWVAATMPPRSSTVAAAPGYAHFTARPLAERTD